MHGPWNFVLDAHALAPPRTGVGRYVEGLLEGWEAQDGDARMPETAWAWLPGQRLWPLSHARVAAAQWDSSTDGGGLRRAARPLVRGLARQLPGARWLWWWWQGGQLRRSLRGATSRTGRLALLAPNFVPPLGLRADVLAITVHDLSCFDLPETHPAARVAFMQRSVPRAVREANVILCVSSFTAGRLAHWFGQEAQAKAVVTPLGVGPTFHPTPAGPEGHRIRADDLDALRRLGVAPEGFFLTVGTLEPRKNLVLALRAHAGLPQRLRNRYPLLVVGPPGWKNSDIEREMTPGLAEGSVRWLGFLPDSTLAALYRNCSLFVYPSRYEGFGLPVAEAMACGAGVLTARGSSLDEVQAGAGVAVDADDVDSARTCLLRAIGDVDWLRRLREASRSCAAHRFSWPMCAAQTWQAIQAACSA